MGKIAFEEYDEWDLAPVLLPMRSMLFSLEPIGVNMPWVESLTSYIARLADAHSVFPGILMEKIVVPRAFGSLPRKGAPTIYTADGTKSNLLNATGIRALRVVQEMEKLTLRKDLSFLTLLTWTEVLYIRGLIRLTRAWCPLCYEQWRISGQTIYDPLLWALLPVTTCVRHHIHLSQRCPYEDCHRQLPGLAWRSRPGYCSYCHRWLGHAQEMVQSPNIFFSEEAWAWQQWVTQSLGSLLARTPTIVAPPTKNQAITVLRRYIQQVVGRKAHVFGKLLGVSREMVGHWLHEEKLPQIEVLLRISYVADVPLDELLLADAEELPPPLRDTSNLQSHAKKEQQPSDVKYLQQALEDILTRNEYPPPSLLEVTRRLGHTYRALYKCHQAACLDIKNRYKIYLQSRITERLQKHREEIRQIALDLRAEGTLLKENRIAAHLIQPGILRDPRIRQFVQEVCSEPEGSKKNVSP
jgi:transcriptional regulator with XRE-family HTH domain